MKVLFHFFRCDIIIYNKTVLDKGYYALNIFFAYLTITNPYYGILRKLINSHFFLIKCKIVNLVR